MDALIQIKGLLDVYKRQALQALDIVLTPDEIAYLEEPYVPHNQYGFR